MFLLIYKCRIAVSVRGKWFWKGWHCKLNLPDRLSAPTDQKMPQSMMSDRQANSPRGQTLPPHFQTLERQELCRCAKVAGRTDRKVGGITFRGLHLMVKNVCDVDGWWDFSSFGETHGLDYLNEDVMCWIWGKWLPDSHSEFLGRNLYRKLLSAFFLLSPQGDDFNNILALLFFTSSETIVAINWIL